MPRTLPFVAIALSVSVPALAQEVQVLPNNAEAIASQSESQGARGTEQEEKVCKYMIKTGTRFKKKICRTTEQWEAMAEASKSTLGEIQRQPRGTIDGE